jgi:hypothetical protein
MPPCRLLLPLLLVAGAAGCGGTTTTPPGFHRVSREAWVSHANRVCADRAAAVRRLPAPRTQNELIDVGARIISLETREHSRLARVHPPAEDQADVSAFLLSIERITRQIDRFRSALMLRNAADLMGARAALAAARRKSNDQAHRLGLTCRH